MSPVKCECIDDAIRNAADDLARLVARCEEAVKLIKDCVLVPPAKPYRSMSTTDRPVSAAAIAAQQPGAPGPDEHDLGLADRRYV
jgi:hypothetical protein